MSDTPSPATAPTPAPTPPTDADIKALAAQVGKVESLKNAVTASTRTLQQQTATLNKESAALEAMRARVQITGPLTPAPALAPGTPTPQTAGK